jgi:hypothetical protein
LSLPLLGLELWSVYRVEDPHRALGLGIIRVDARDLQESLVERQVMPNGILAVVPSAVSRRSDRGGFTLPNSPASQLQDST